MAATGILVERRARALDRIKSALGAGAVPLHKGPPLQRETLDLEWIADALERRQRAGNAPTQERKD